MSHFDRLSPAEQQLMLAHHARLRVTLERVNAAMRDGDPVEIEIAWAAHTLETLGSDPMAHDLYVTLRRAASAEAAPEL